MNHYIVPNILYIKGSPESAKEGWREAFAWRVPVVGVNHLRAHAFSPFIALHAANPAAFDQQADR